MSKQPALAEASALAVNRSSVSIRAPVRRALFSPEGMK
jgi:hypothetical protein